MLLTVSDNKPALEKLYRIFCKSHYFSYFATCDRLLAVAKRYKPQVILIETDTINDALITDIEKIRTLLPNVFLITLSNEDTSPLSPVFSFRKGAYSGTVLRSIASCMPLHPSASSPRENMIVHGLHMDLHSLKISLYGEVAPFSNGEAFFLRYLCEIYPRRAPVMDLGKHCFGPYNKAPRTTVASRISRINAKATAVLGFPIITYIRNVGYQIDF